MHALTWVVLLFAFSLLAAGCADSPTTKGSSLRKLEQAPGSSGEGSNGKQPAEGSNNK